MALTPAWIARGPVLPNPITSWGGSVSWVDRYQLIA